MNIGRYYSFNRIPSRWTSSLKKASEIPLESSELPSEAKVVICGGGLKGAAIAYKLAQRGLGKQTVILEQEDLLNASKWHSNGIIGHFGNSFVESRLCKMSFELYREIERKGFYTGWKKCSMILLAKHKDRMHQFKRMKAESIYRAVDCHLLTPKEISEKCPIVRVEDLKGGLWFPNDGIANPTEISLALLHLSSSLGVQIISNCKVKKILAENGEVSGIDTSKGFVKTSQFVNAAGFWARNVGNMSNPRVNVPLSPAEHYTLHSKLISDLSSETPIIKDLDGWIYARENDGKILAGGFEPFAKPAFSDKLPENNKERESPVDWDHFHILLDNLLHRFPSLGDVELEKLVNGPEAFSPDGQWILGQAPEIKNYFVMGANASDSLEAAGGMAEVMADVILKGSFPFDMYNLDIQRFLGMHNNKRFLRDRVKEIPGFFYAIDYPFREFKSGRSLRTSPIFPMMRNAGACFSQVMGYERAAYFLNPSSSSSSSIGLDSSFSSTPSNVHQIQLAKTKSFFKPYWFESVENEFKASREAVSICDYSSFAKFHLWSSGAEVLDFLQYTSSNDIDIPIGTIVHTGMQNVHGGFENDCSVARLAENHYMLMSPSIQQMRSYTLLKNLLPSTVQLQDVTSLYTALCIMGPQSRALLSKLTNVSSSEDLTSKSFPYFSCRQMDIGCAPDILTMNLTHTGENGYSLYIPNEFAVHVYECILEAGKEFGIRQCGYYAMRALRIEKFYAFWGQDLDSGVTPLECGRSFRVKKSGNFIGREALEKQSKEGIKKVLVMVLLDPLDHDSDTDPWPWGGEPLFRNGVCVGHVTTTSFGFSINKIVALGFIIHPKGNFISLDWIKSGDYTLDIAGTMYRATVALNRLILPNKQGANTYNPTQHNFN